MENLAILIFRAIKTCVIINTLRYRTSSCVMNNGKNFFLFKNWVKNQKNIAKMLSTDAY